MGSRRHDALMMGAPAGAVNTSRDRKKLQTAPVTRDTSHAVVSYRLESLRQWQRPSASAESLRGLHQHEWRRGRAEDEGDDRCLPKATRSPPRRASKLHKMKRLAFRPVD